MKTRFMFFIFIMLSAAFGITVFTQGKISTGDAVFAEWTPNGWYHGTVGEPCEKGFTVNFDDGDVKCCEPGQIVADRVPSADGVSPGMKVLAKWSNGKFYPGTVKSLSEGTYLINFDDGDKGSVTIEGLRLRN